MILDGLDRRLFVVSIDGDEGRWMVGLRGKQRALKWARDESCLVHGTIIAPVATFACTMVIRPKARSGDGTAHASAHEPPNPMKNSCY